MRSLLSTSLLPQEARAVPLDYAKHLLGLTESETIALRDQGTLRGFAIGPIEFITRRSLEHYEMLHPELFTEQYYD